MFSDIKDEINSVLERDPAAKSRIEVFFCYPGFHAIMVYRGANWLWRRGFRFWPRWLSQVARFLTGIEIHPGATIGHRFFIDHGMGVVIGETARIGDNVTIYHGVTLGGVSTKPGIRHPQVGNNVIIGSGAQLLGPIMVGDGARIGSNAVVVKDVPESATMVGVPARNVAKSTDSSFSAYGMPLDQLPDMVMKNFEDMNRLITTLALRIDELETQNKDLAETAGSWELKKK